MTPYLNPTTAKQEAYNKSHKGTRVAIKQTFGWWKCCFHLLHFEVQMSPEKICQLIRACAVLHNIAVFRNEPTDGIHCDEDQQVIVPYHGPENGKAVIDYICNTFF